MNINRMLAAMAMTGAFAGAGAAQAQGAPAVCAPLSTIIAAADATPTWRGVSQGSAGTLVPSGFARCFTTSYSSSADYVCDAEATAATIGARYDSLVADLGRCLGGAPTIQRDGISTYSTWRAPGGAEITATKVEQPAARNFSLGLTVRRSF